MAALYKEGGGRLRSVQYCFKKVSAKSVNTSNLMKHLLMHGVNLRAWRNKSPTSEVSPRPGNVTPAAASMVSTAPDPSSSITIDKVVGLRDASSPSGNSFLCSIHITLLDV